MVAPETVRRPRPLILVADDDVVTTQIIEGALAQEAFMPRPEDIEDGRFQVSFTQILKAGGDFYDVIPIADSVIDYVVADASGHDLGGSVWTAALKALLGEYSNAVNSPREVL